MTELSPVARALIDAGAPGDQPTADDRARIRGRLSAQLGAAALGAGVVTSVAAHATSASAASTTAATKGLASIGFWGATGKLFIGASIVGVASATLLVGVPASPKETAKGSAPSATVVQGAPRPAQPAEVPAPAVGALVMPDALESEREGAEEKREVRVQRPRRAARSAGPAPESLAEELSLIGAAQAALRRGDAPGALEAVEAHQTRFAHGALREERQAVQMIARCMLGERDDAALASYLEQAADGPLKQRVVQRCKP